MIYELFLQKNGFRAIFNVMKTLKFFSDDIARRYGRKLQRIPIDLALGCPNRLNRYGEGCIFCAEDGSRARHLARHPDLAGQVREGMAYVKSRYHSDGPYIAYFQAFTSTFAPVEELRRMYMEVLEQADFKVIIIGTRPDALEPEKIAFLQELSRNYEVWVELGVQSAHDRTLELINRGHDFESVRRCVSELADAGIHCACHVILGLPGETMPDWVETARAIAGLPFEAVKLHQLMVLKKTPLARAYAATGHPAHPVPLNEYEYAAGAAAFLRELPENWTVMRLNADADTENIIAPRWWMSKGQFIEFFREFFASGQTSVFQGVRTADGSHTLYHPGFRQHFHSMAGAESEAVHKFIRPSQLPERLQRGDVALLDIGFGLGVNAAAAVRCAAEIKHGRLAITSLELDMRTLQAALNLYPADSLEYRMLDALLKNGVYRSEYADITLLQGDARQTIRQCGFFDAVFQDGFSPDCNPELWTLDFLRELAGHLNPDAVMASYSSAYPFRGALLKLGFAVGESVPFGRKRGGTVSGRTLPETALALPDKEYGIIMKSTAGVPYRDPALADTREAILARHSGLVARLRRMGVPKWYKK